MKKRPIALAAAGLLLLSCLTGCRSYAPAAEDCRKAGVPQGAPFAVADGTMEPDAADAARLTGYTTVCENGALRLLYHPETAAVAVLDRRTGKVWYAVAPDAADDATIGADTLPLFRSQLTVRYIDGQNEKTLDSWSASVARGTFSAEMRGDGLDVTYHFIDDRTDEGADGEREMFRFTLCYTLDSDALIADLPLEKAAYPAGIQPLEIGLLPHFGGSTGDDGYLLIPDGSGALVDFSVPKAAGSSTYIASVYGSDPSLDVTDAPVKEQGVLLPVFGVRCAQDAFLAVIEDGEALATVRATAAGSLSSYNEVYASFTVHAAQPVKIGDSVGNSRVMGIQSTAYSGSLRVRYALLDRADADYSGMARYYRAYLIENGALPEKSDAAYALSVALLGAVEKRKTFLGIQYTGTEKLTDTAEAEQILRALRAGGADSIDVRYLGWSAGGLDPELPTGANVLSAIGGKKGLTALRDYCVQNGAALYPLVRVTSAKNGSRGLSRFRMVARQIDQNNAKVYTYDTVTRKDDGYRFILRTEAAAAVLEKFRRKSAALGIGAFALDEIGGTVFADYTKGSVVDRQSTVQLYGKMLSAATADGDRLMLTGGAVYGLAYADIVTEAPFSDSGYAVCDRSVPFWQMVVHGSLRYSCAPLDLTADPETDLLRCIEYGGQPDFVLMAADGSSLRDTAFDRYHSCSADVWSDTAAQMYTRAAAVLSPVQGHAMVRHERVSDGVYAAGYDNGCTVFVNYTEQDVSVGGVRVPARDAVLTEGGESR